MAAFEFESVNFPRHFIRHANFAGELTRHSGPIAEFSFTLVRRGEHLVALRSTNFPDRVLRHRDGRLLLEGPNDPNGHILKEDSTFFFEFGLTRAEGTVSFRSFNFPTWYLRHRDFHLWVEEPGADRELFNRDATFIQRPGSVLIDHGTEGVPADE